jgi:hypothetical protein
MSDEQDEFGFDFAPPGKQRSKLEQAFWDFHEEHPSVYDTLVMLARDWKERRVQRIGIATVFETARYLLEIERDDDGLKLNNNHRAYYARLIMRDEPDLEDIFRLRQQRIQATIGPDNDGLEPGGHIG